MKRWFLPSEPDLIGMLTSQACVTVGGLEAFARWSAGTPEAEHEVRLKEHEADEARRQVLITVRNAFVTPISPEDAFELAERLDAVLNAAKNTVRETEVLQLSPDQPMAEMAEVVAEGVGHLARAFAVLVSDPDSATSAADDAVSSQRKLERIYRQAMSSLVQEDELREVMGRRELYRRYSRMGEAVEHVAHRVWYAVVKEE